MRNNIQKEKQREEEILKQKSFYLVNNYIVDKVLEDTQEFKSRSIIKEWKSILKFMDIVKY